MEDGFDFYSYCFDGVSCGLEIIFCGNFDVGNYQDTPTGGFAWVIWAVFVVNAKVLEVEGVAVREPGFDDECNVYLLGL